MSKSAESALAELFAAAKAAQANAYAPYSRFKVGAALSAPSGALYAGCNVENAAYPEGVCAETSAISAMARAGRAAHRRDLRHRRRRSLMHAVRRLPAAHPRICRRRDDDPCRRAPKACARRSRLSELLPHSVRARPSADREKSASRSRNALRRGVINCRFTAENRHPRISSIVHGQTSGRRRSPVSSSAFIRALT